MENKIIDFINSNSLNYKKTSFIVDQISLKLGLPKGKIINMLEDLKKEGLLVDSAKNKIATAEKMNLIKGTLSGHSKGFAFVIPEDSSQPHIFIPPKALNSALHNDIVLVRTVEGKRGNSTEGQIFSILKRGTLKIVGTMDMLDGYGFVIPDNNKFNKDIFVARNKLNGAKNNQKVVVKITKFDTRRPEGQVIEVLGDKLSPAVEVLSIIRDYDLREEFSDHVLNATSKIKQSIDEADLKGRLDLRKEKIFTIDGDDAKDLDDAINIKYDKAKDLYTLGVHIADVGHYVKLNSIVDREAFKRGTSVYFPHTVLPMLPRELSNGICSLHPKVDRLTLSIFMDIDSTGKVQDYKLYESVINSVERLTYKNATAILEQDKEMNERYKNIASDLKQMETLAKLLEKRRMERGSLDFDLPETKIIVDPLSYEVTELVRRDRKASHKLIESFMLIANETVAEHMHNLKMPFVYRVHEKPTEAKMLAFKEYLEPFGLRVKDGKGEVSPMDLQKFLSKIEDLEYKDVINKVLLRSMQKAKYKPQCLGHFGLAAKYYSHFTSPIRRYPDLTIHRIIKDYLNKKTDEKYKKRLTSFVEESGEQSSVTEANAEKCERQVDDYFKAKYMEDKIGMEFEGTISGVTQFGLFVELDNTIEGFIRLDSLPGQSYQFIEHRFMLTNNHNTFKMGDHVKVKVISANALSQSVDFMLQ